MPELHAHPDFDHLLGVAGRGGRCADPERQGCPPEEGNTSSRIGGGGEEQSLRLLRQRLETSEKVLLKLAGEVAGVRDREAACKLDAAHRLRQLQQSEGVSAGFSDDPIPDADVNATRDSGGEKCPGIFVAEAVEDQFRQPRQLSISAWLADRKQHQHGLGEDSPRHKAEHLSGYRVKPLCVINDAQQRTLQRDFGQQIEGGQGYEEAIRSLTRGQPERHAQRVLLRLREAPNVREQGRAELMQSRKWQLHLGLRARDPGEREAHGLTDAMLKQRCLTDSGFAAHDDGGALTGLNPAQQPAQLVPL